MADTFTRPALVIIDVQNAIDDPAWPQRNNPQAETTIAGLEPESGIEPLTYSLRMRPASALC